MANDNEKFPGAAFSIDETVSMGRGDATLLDDLISSETATGNPEDIEPIVKEINEDAPPAKGKVSKKSILGDEEDEDGSGGSEKNQNSLSNFLDDDEEDDDDDDGELPPIKKVKDKAVDNKDESEDEDANAESTQFEALSNDLYKLGVFTTNEEDYEEPVKTAEEFLARFQAEKQKGAMEVLNNFIGQFGEDYQNAFDAIYVKGVNPKEYFGVYNEVVNFSELDLTQEANQVKVIRKGLSDQGYEPEDIDTEIERFRNYGDLEVVSAKHHKVLIKKEAIKLQEMEQQATADIQRKAQIKGMYVQNVQNILSDKVKAKEFDGIPINPQLASELQEFLLVDKWKSQSGELLTDFDRFILDMKKPENHAMKVKVALLFKILEKDPTLSTIQKRVSSKRADNLFESTTRQTKVGKPNTEPRSPSSWFLK